MLVKKRQPQKTSKKIWQNSSSEHSTYISNITEQKRVHLFLGCIVLSERAQKTQSIQHNLFSIRGELDQRGQRRRAGNNRVAAIILLAAYTQQSLKVLEFILLRVFNVHRGSENNSKNLYNCYSRLLMLFKLLLVKLCNWDTIVEQKVYLMAALKSVTYPEELSSSFSILSSSLASAATVYSLINFNSSATRPIFLQKIKS